MGTGISNNGGSRTLIRSANIIQKLGHNIKILNDTLNHSYNWDKVNVPILTPKNIKDIPDADVIIATGYGSWEKTLNLPDRCGKKFIWVRGWEIWNTNETNIVKILSNENFNIIVNSICLQNKLKEFNIDSKIIRPGYDFDEIFPLNIRKNSDSIIIGALYSKGQKRSNKRVNWIFETIKNIKKDKKVCLVMFGGEGNPANNNPVDLFVANPTHQRKNEIYNQCDIWLAPTKNDSLHLPPAEAMQTECCIIGTDAPMNGMKDYLTNTETGLISENNIEDFETRIRLAINEPNLREELGKNAREKILSLGTREQNMNKLINYLEDNVYDRYHDDCNEKTQSY